MIHLRRTSFGEVYEVEGRMFSNVKDARDYAMERAHHSYDDALANLQAAQEAEQVKIAESVVGVERHDLGWHDRALWAARIAEILLALDAVRSSFAKWEFRHLFTQGTFVHGEWELLDEHNNKLRTLPAFLAGIPGQDLKIRELILRRALVEMRYKHGDRSSLTEAVNSAMNVVAGTLAAT